MTKCKSVGVWSKSAETRRDARALSVVRTDNHLWPSGSSRGCGRQLKPKAEYGRIQQVPGIGAVLGLVVVLESGEQGKDFNEAMLFG